MAKDKFSRTKACATKTLYAVMYHRGTVLLCQPTRKACHFSPCVTISDLFLEFNIIYYPQSA